jgi:hypothetical protein
MEDAWIWALALVISLLVMPFLPANIIKSSTNFRIFPVGAAVAASLEVCGSVVLASL